MRPVADPSMKSPSLLHAVKRLADAGPEARRFALRAWLGAPVVRASLSVAGLARTLRWVEAVAPRAQRPGAVGVEEGEALVRAVFRRHFVGGACLPQSLVQYLLHRRDGLPVRFVVGVQRVERGAVDAHAWVEDHEPRAGEFAAILATGAERRAA